MHIVRETLEMRDEINVMRKKMQVRFDRDGLCIAEDFWDLLRLILLSVVDGT